MSQNQEASAALVTGWQRLAAVVDAELGMATASLHSPESDLSHRTAQCESHRQQKRQAALEQVLQLTVQELEKAGTEDKPQAVDAGWLGGFLEEASHAVHETEQHIWARLLAREIVSPGSTALRTLHFLSSMDHWEVEAFIEYCGFVFAFDSGWRFVFEEDAVRRELWAYGREIDIGQHLINIGLISKELNRVEAGTARGLRIRYVDNIYAFEAEKVDGETIDPSAGFHYRRFTPQGQQLAEAIKTKRFNGYARNVVEALKRELGVPVSRVED